MNLHLITSSRGRRGTTLIETMIVAGMSVVVAATVYSTFNMVSKFAQQGFTETRLLNRASIAVEEISRTLNHAYRPDSLPPYPPVIADDNKSITFTVPTEALGSEVRRLRFDEANAVIHYERQDADSGDFSEMSGASLLTNVEDFYITNQEGVLSFVVSVIFDMGVNGEKRYSLVGRALPRNL